MCVTSELCYIYTDHSSNGLMMAVAGATVILSSNGPANVTDVHC
jgi:hypothetical protein